MKDPVCVPAEVLRGLEAVRRSGRTNMFDWLRVTEVAREMGHTAAADWIWKHGEQYVQGLFHGFIAADDQEEG